MGFVPTAGAVRADIQFLLQGQQCHNVIWCTRNENWTDVQRLALAQAITDWWTGSAKSYFSTDMVLNQITVVNQETESAPSSVLIPTGSLTGVRTGTPAPNNVAAVATLRTALRGRSYRGRMYLGGISMSDITNAITLSSSWIATVLTLLAALKTAIEGLGAIWVVVSKQHNKVALANGVKTPVAAISMDTYVDSQRRRLGLRGV